ncbi:hypothetical protein LPJ66_005967, partial [Kickxella alabastrina]
MTNDAPSNDAAGTPKSRGLREGIATKLRLGKGGQKARRGSTPRTSQMTESNLAKFTQISSNTGSSTSSAIAAASAAAAAANTEDARSMTGNIKKDAAILENLNERLQRITEGVAPFRVKFENNKGEATMSDVYPEEEFNEVLQKVTAKLRMSRHSDYIIMYKDTDDEDIAVACTDHLREMFGLFEPGCRLQLKIVPFNINNSGALDSIAKIWEYGLTPNVFVDEVESDDSSDEVDLTHIKLATDGHQKEEKKAESAAETAVATAAAALAEAKAVAEKAAADAAAAAGVAAAAELKASEAATAASAAVAKAEAEAKARKEAEEAANQPSSTKAEPPSPASPSSNTEKKDGDELRQAILMMSSNLSLAIESLGTRLTHNFDKL